MRNEIKSLIEKIKDAELKYNSNKSKENKKELESRMNDAYRELVRGSANKEEIEENTYIISNLLPIELRAFNGSWYLSSLLLEIPQVELNKSVWGMLVKNNLLKKSNAKPIYYTISPYCEGIDKIYQKIVPNPDVISQERLQGVNFQDNTATGTDAYKLLHLVAENNKQKTFNKDGNYFLYSNIKKTYDKLKPKETLKSFYEKRGEIEEKFPNWLAITPHDYEFYKSFDLDYLNSVLLTLNKNKLVNTETRSIAFEFDTKDGVFHIGLNAELLSELCESMIMAGQRIVNFYFSSPFRAVVIINDKIKFPKKADEDFYMKNTFGLIMPVQLDESSVNEGANFPKIKYNDTYDFDIRIGISPSYNLIQGEGKTNSKKETKTESKADLYRELIEGYELALEIETDKKKIKMYNDLIEGYELALELE
jgi:hypothetical protein